VFFVGPQGLALDDYRSRWPKTEFVAFEPFHFKDISAYNRWMLTPDLYERFQDFEFVLVCQTDALLVEPLPIDEPWSFDYLGAPWEPSWRIGWNPFTRCLNHEGFTLPKRVLSVGNGGLSLRRTSVFRGDLPFPRFRQHPNEDIAISYFHSRLGIRLATTEVAARYFMERGSRDWTIGAPIPQVFGFHALAKINPGLEDTIIQRNSNRATDA
jgi:hypothetical protein